MAPSGSSKWFSERHEKKIAKQYGGKRSPSSGAAVVDQGDVRTSDCLVECKHTGTFDKPARSISVKLADLEKITKEAWSEGKQPVMALGIYSPHSVLADKDGEVNLIVRLMPDDYQGRFDVSELHGLFQ